MDISKVDRLEYLSSNGGRNLITISVELMIDQANKVFPGLLSDMSFIEKNIEITLLLLFLPEVIKKGKRRYELHVR